MITAGISLILLIALIVSVGANVLLYRRYAKATTQADRYKTISHNFSRLVSGCKRCNKVLNDKLKRKNAAKVGLQREVGSNREME